MIRWRFVVKAIIYFVIAVMFSMVTFYKMTNETGTDGMILWRQVETQPIGFIFTTLFLVLGIIELTGVEKNESK